MNERQHHLNESSSARLGRAGEDNHGPEPTQPSGEDGRIMKYLEDWRRMYENGKERRGAAREEMATPDDGLACTEERLAAKRVAELEERAKVIEQLTSTGTEMTTEEHVVTAETHLRYAEGHLQPSEEHLADAEVHLKLVKAHLVALEVAEPAETGTPEAAVLPPPETASVRPVRGEPRWPLRKGIGVPLSGPGRGLCSGGGNLARERPTLERGRTGRVLSTSVRTRRPTPWMNVKSSEVCRSPRGGRRSRSGIAVSAASQTAGTGRQAPGVTAGSGFGGTTY